jgi:hypothetical protein
VGDRFPDRTAIIVALIAFFDSLNEAAFIS